LDVVPGETVLRLYGSDHDQAVAAGAPEETDFAAADDLPASAFGETAPVRSDRRVSRPPVRQVVGLGEQRPGIASCRNQLGLGLDPHGAVIVTISARHDFGAESIHTCADFAVRLAVYLS
jgi:hypothetical protein